MGTGFDADFPAAMVEGEPVGTAAGGGKCDLGWDCASKVPGAAPGVVVFCGIGCDGFCRVPRWCGAEAGGGLCRGGLLVCCCVLLLSFPVFSLPPFVRGTLGCAGGVPLGLLWPVCCRWRGWWVEGCPPEYHAPRECPSRVPLVVVVLGVWACAQTWNVA